MKCGKDLDTILVSEVPPEIIEVDTLTASGSSGVPSYATPNKKESGPLPDVDSYKEAAASSAASEEVVSPVEYDDETPEIHMTDVTTDFTERRIICGICGSTNPNEQRYCKQCGSALGDETPHSAGVMSVPQAAPISDGPVETTTLADMAPSSDYHAAGPVREKRSRAGGGLGDGLAEWGGREWFFMVIAAIFVAVLIWFFVFGGMNALFNSGARNIKKAGEVMTGMAGCQYNLTATLESHETAYAGSGQLVYESLDKTAWQLLLDVPGKGPVLLQHVQIGDESYSNCGESWQMSDEGDRADMSGLWSDISGVEDMGEESMLGHACLHYKYRTPPRLITHILCAGEQSGVSDTVVDMWIDKESYCIVRVSADTFNIQSEGMRTKATLIMDIGVTDQAFGINAPI